MVERVFCEVCLKEVPKSEAAMAEARDYVAYFCGLEAPEEMEIQLGHRHTQRDVG